MMVLDTETEPILKAQPPRCLFEKPWLGGKHLRALSDYDVAPLTIIRFHRAIFRIVLAASIFLGGSLTNWARGSENLPAPADPTVDFTQQILPILSNQQVAITIGMASPCGWQVPESRADR